MSDAFRDGLQAALQRAENLEEENDILRDEIAQLRQSSEALREHATPHVTSPSTAHRETRELADKALDVLEKLEAVSKRGSKLRVAAGEPHNFSGTERALTATTAPPKHEAEPDPDGLVALLAPNPTTKTANENAPASANRGGVPVSLWLLTAAVCLFVGYLLGASR